MQDQVPTANKLPPGMIAINAIGGRQRIAKLRAQVNLISSGAELIWTGSSGLCLSINSVSEECTHWNMQFFAQVTNANASKERRAISQPISNVPTAELSNLVSSSIKSLTHANYS